MHTRHFSFMTGCRGTLRRVRAWGSGNVATIEGGGLERIMHRCASFRLIGPLTNYTSFPFPWDPLENQNLCGGIWAVLQFCKKHGADVHLWAQSLFQRSKNSRIMQHPQRQEGVLRCMLLHMLKPIFELYPADEVGLRGYCKLHRRA